MLDTGYQSMQQEDLSSTHASAFSDWLVAKTRENAIRKASLLGASQELRRATIVVVDDEPHIAITLSEILERRGYQAIWFTEPYMALALMRAYRPDLLLTDVNMPLLDGFDLTLCLKRMYPSCPVLIVSAIGDGTELAERIAAAGVSVAVETKPVQVCRLLSRIADLISPQGYASMESSASPRLL